MQSSYLKAFENLFFNLEMHEEVKAIIDQASYLLDLIITKFGELENEMTIGSSRKNDFDDIVIILFIRKIMELLDSINILYSVCLFEPAQIILRSLTENIVELEFILKEDTHKRAAAYFFEHHYQELEKSKIYLNPESEYVKAIISQKGKNEFDEVSEKTDKKRRALERLIKSDPVFQEIDIARNKKIKAKKKKNKKYIQWYEVCSNITSIKGLWNETGYGKYFDGIYGGLSFESHGLNAAMGMNVDEKGPSLKLIRNPEGGETTFGITCLFCVELLHKIYQYLEYGKSKTDEYKAFYDDFKKKYDQVSNNLNMIRSYSAYNAK